MTREDELSIRRRRRRSPDASPRLDTGLAWAEDPGRHAPATYHQYQVAPGEAGSELKVYSKLIVYRSTGREEEDFYVGGQDVLRRVDGAGRSARRN